VSSTNCETRVVLAGRQSSFPSVKPYSNSRGLSDLPNIRQLKPAHILIFCTEFGFDTWN